MVGTVEQEFCTTGNGAEFADYKPLAINWIMV